MASIDAVGNLGVEPAENAAPVAFDHACRRDHRRQAAMGAHQYHFLRKAATTEETAISGSRTRATVAAQRAQLDSLSGREPQTGRAYRMRLAFRSSTSSPPITRGVPQEMVLVGHTIAACRR